MDGTSPAVWDALTNSADLDVSSFTYLKINKLYFVPAGVRSPNFFESQPCKLFPPMVCWHGQPVSVGGVLWQVVGHAAECGGGHMGLLGWLPLVGASPLGRWSDCRLAASFLEHEHLIMSA